MDLKFGVAFNMKTPIANGGAPNARSDGGVRPIVGKLSSRGTHRAIKQPQKSFPLDVRAGSVLGGGRALNVNIANFGMKTVSDGNGTKRDSSGVENRCGKWCHMPDSTPGRQRSKGILLGGQSRGSSEPVTFRPDF